MKNEVIAFDIGGTNTRCALIKNNKIKKFASVKTPNNKKDFLENLTKMTKENMSPNVKGIGIAFPGLIEKGVIKNAHNLSVKHFDLKGYMKRKFKLPVEVFNDAGCVAIAESKLGCKKKNFFVVTLGTGIGGGIIVNGEPYRGQGRGAEFGHAYVNGKEFESLWKKTKKRIAKEYGKGMLIKDLVKKKERKAYDIMEEAADYLGKGMASLISDFDPEIVVLAGGLKESGPKFIKMIEKKTREYSYIKRKIKVRWSNLKEPGVFGAGLLIS